MGGWKTRLQQPLAESHTSGIPAKRVYERCYILAPINLLFDEWTEVFDSERLTGALLDRLKRSRENAAAQAPDELDNP